MEKNQKMKNIRFVILVYFSLLQQMSFSQEKYNPLFSIGYGSAIYPYITTHEIEIANGIHWDKSLSIQFFCRGIIFNGGLSNFNTSWDPSFHKTIVLGLQASYRFLDYWISPVYAINGGTSVYSNARGEFINRGLTLQEYFDPTVYKHNHAVFFGKSKILLDFKFKGFNAQIGSVFNYYLLRVTKLNQKWSTDYEEGSKVFRQFYTYGFEANLIYTLNRKKNEK